MSTKQLPKEKYDAIILTVSHDVFGALDIELLKKETSVVYDVKNFLSKEIKDKGL